MNNYFKDTSRALIRMQEIAGMGIWRKDSKNSQLWWSDQAYRMLGLHATSESMNFEKFLQLVHEDDRALVKDQVDRLLSLEITEYTIEYRIINTQGEIKYIREEAVVEKDSQANHYYTGILQDITQVSKTTVSKLDKSKAYFKALIENISDIITVLDANGKILYRSTPLTDILGYDSKAKDNYGMIDSAIPEDRPQLQKLLKKFLRYPNQLVPINFRAYHHDGILHYFEGTGINLLNSPDVGGIVINYRDVTPVRIAEQALKANEEKYRIVADFNYDWEYWIGNDGNFLYVSPSCERISGYQPQDFYEDSHLLYDLIIAEDKHLFLNHEHLVDLNSQKISIEFRIKTRTNEVRWIEHVCQQIFNEHGQPLGIRGSNTDITDRKKAEQAAAMTEMKFQAIFNNNPNPTHLVNTNFEIELTNATLLGMKNVKQGEILGEKCYKIYQDSNNICQKCNVKKVFEEQTSTKSENKLVLFNGETKYFETFAYPIFNDVGEITHAVETTVDITARKKMQHLLELSEAKLRESLQTKDRFLSIIAHDLRSPFQSILGFANLLKDNFDQYTQEEQKKFIGIIQDGIQNTYGLLENLLLWSNSRKGNIHFLPERLNLLDLIQEIFDLMNQLMINKGVTLDVHVAVDIQAIADREMLSSIIRNLLSNALKFTRKNGAIEIEAHYIKSSDNQDYTEIIVSDNGVGISEERQEKLFSIDENVSTKGTEKESGSGLGLVLCRELVEQHGGEIEVESEVGQGTSFKFKLPFYKL